MIIRTNARTFSPKFDANLAQYLENVRLARNKLAVDYMRLLQQSSPVDTGRFRANWQFGTSFVIYEPNQLGLDATVDTIKTLPLGQSIIITNNVAYARRLINGYSKQAPADFHITAWQRITATA